MPYHNIMLNKWNNCLIECELANVTKLLSYVIIPQKNHWVTKDFILFFFKTKNYSLMKYNVQQS
jgi:hypothetical protein